MTLAFIKYLFVIFCSAYSAIKMLNLKNRLTLKAKVALIPILTLVLCLVIPIRQYYSELSLIVMFSFSIIAYKYLFQISYSQAIISTILSYGISYITYYLGILSITAVSLINRNSPPVARLTHVLLPGIVQALLCILLFRIKRLRNGFPFLSDLQYGNLGICSGISILVLVSILSIECHSSSIISALVFAIILFGVIILFWTKSRIKQKYLDQLRARELTDLNNTITELTNQLELYKKENEEFSRIIHKDNKLIPALELSVKELLYYASQETDHEKLSARADAMLAQLETISSERTGIVKNYEHLEPSLPLTGLPTLDSLFSYMLQKATFAGISLAFDINRDACSLLSTRISGQDISTLLADLLDNAIIAVKHQSAENKIKVVMGEVSGCFQISVSDSGIPFSEEVLQKFGVEQITTHADSGGSGIGLLSIRSICMKWNISIFIDCCNAPAPYTKCISLRFDDLGNFLINNHWEN